VGDSAVTVSCHHNVPDIMATGLGKINNNAAATHSALMQLPVCVLRSSALWAQWAVIEPHNP